MGIPLVKYVKDESGKFREIGIVEVFDVRVPAKNPNFKITKNNFHCCIPENAISVWMLERDFGISITKSKIIRNIRNGNLNAFMIGFDGVIIEKWWIDVDDKFFNFLDKYIDR